MPERYATKEDIKQCPHCEGIIIEEIKVDHPDDPYTVTEHIYLGKYGKAISGKRKCT